MPERHRVQGGREDEPGKDTDYNSLEWEAIKKLQLRADKRKKAEERGDGSDKSAGVFFFPIKERDEGQCEKPEDQNSFGEERDVTGEKNCGSDPTEHKRHSQMKPVESLFEGGLGMDQKTEGVKNTEA